MPRPTPPRRGARKLGPSPAAPRARLVVGGALAAILAAAALIAGLWGGRWAGRVARPDARALRDEARSALARDRPAEARLALERASTLDPADAETWRARLDLLRVLDRPAEALRLAREGLRAVGPGGRRGLLASATLAVLAEPPDDEARAILGRWAAAEPDDPDARVALLARFAANPHPGDPDRAARIAELGAILARSPGHVAAREALAVALADAGEPDRGRAVLDAWPEAGRDARYDRLRGRWDLDYDRRPDRAADAFRRALAGLPHDWKIHYGLARALRSLGRDAEARDEAGAVARLRERLEPSSLGARLAGDLARPDDPRALLDLADLCEGVGLAGLADAWRAEARGEPVR